MYMDVFLHDRAVLAHQCCVGDAAEVESRLHQQPQVVANAQTLSLNPLFCKELLHALFGIVLLVADVEEGRFACIVVGPFALACHRGAAGSAAETPEVEHDERCVVFLAYVAEELGNFGIFVRSVEGVVDKGFDIVLTNEGSFEDVNKILKIY